jgi:NAD-dependent deacetylase
MTREPTTDTIEAAARELGEAHHAVALTGAGISTASGLPSFRGDDGIWGEEFDPADFHYSRFKSDPAGFWRDRVDLHETMYGGDVEPNAAHAALADLEAAGTLDALITQNVDGLHEAAGSESVIELHGNARRVACESCGRRVSGEPFYEQARDGDVPPRCESCGGILKPDVVLFGEQLPTGALQQAQKHARRADVFLAIGSSLTVQPAASLPRVASQRDATLVVVNLEETPLSDEATYDLRADVTEVLPALADTV